ncbi:MAG: hypothetical protein EHM70_01670 [Chloroflexota bacterium]|nr:MAG: hypothetical protein EHM70_01670 [Chloroflexota bacterium]
MSDSSPVLYCANHPNVETSLRCRQCNKPICAHCAVLTPTGYKCKECVRGQQKVFETAQWYDYPLAFTLAVILSFLGSLLVPTLSFFTIFIAPVAGTVIAEVVRFVLRRRRSMRLFRVTALAAALGSLPLFVIGLFVFASVIVGQFAGYNSVLDLVWQGLYTFLVTSTMYYRLSGIQMRL